jgi:hypothetical protein
MKSRGSLNTESMSKTGYIFYIMRHPVEGYEELRWNKKSSLKLSIVILLAWFITEIVKFTGTGFIVNKQNPENLNIFIIFLNTIIIFTICIISNWCFCSVLDGEGKFKEIWITCSYALAPYIIITLLVTLASNFIVKQEYVFLQYIQAAGIGWMCILMIAAIKVTHQYNLRKTILSIFLTALGVCIVLFICMLFLSMLQNFLIFIDTLYWEIVFRCK